MQQLKSISLRFYGPPRQCCYDVEGELIASWVKNECVICGALGTLKTVYARVTLWTSKGEKSVCRGAGSVIRKAFPHAKGFCPKHEAYITPMIERGIRTLQKTKPRKEVKPRKAA